MHAPPNLLYTILQWAQVISRLCITSSARYNLGESSSQWQWQKRLYLSSKKALNSQEEERDAGENPTMHPEVYHTHVLQLVHAPRAQGGKASAQKLQNESSPLNSVAEKLWAGGT